ncbi:MAG: hypothetical protein WCP12_00090 [bacterium]
MDEQTLPTIPPKATPMGVQGAPRPITVRLKPIAPFSATPEGTGSPVPPNAPVSADAATVRLRPVSPSTTAQLSPGGTASSTSQIAATLQAAKSKTSRISLDSAIGVATSIPISPSDNSAPKTIRLKRPTDLTTPGAVAQFPISPLTTKAAAATIIPPPATRSPTTAIRQTSRIPDSVIPTESSITPAPADTSTVTQKKTLKIRRPGAPNALAVTSESAEGDSESVDDIQMTPISEIEANDAPISKGYKAFTVASLIFASVAAILLVVLNWCLAADTIAPLADKNASASIAASVEINWPGKFVQ